MPISQVSALSLPLWDTQDVPVGGTMRISYSSLRSRLRGAAVAAMASTDETWSTDLGFQTPDPLTDFRSGNVLSLVLTTILAESEPTLVKDYAR